MPRLIGLLTADGRVPTGIPAAVSSWLSGPVTAPLTAPAYRAKPVRAFAGPALWKWLVPLLALGALALWFLWPATRAVDPSREPAPPAAQVTGSGDAFPAKVYFPTGSTAIGAEDSARIGRVANYLKATPEAVVEITGFADRTGGADLNEEIAKERAQAVRAALLAAGVAETRTILTPPTSVTGSGNDAEARRVEIRLRP